MSDKEGSCVDIDITTSETELPHNSGNETMKTERCGVMWSGNFLAEVFVSDSPRVHRAGMMKPVVLELSLLTLRLVMFGTPTGFKSQICTPVMLNQVQRVSL